MGTVSRPARGFKRSGQIGGGKVVEGFECGEEVFVLNPVLYREPVQLGGGDVVSRLGAADDPGRRVLNDLDFIEEFDGKARKDSIALCIVFCKLNTFKSQIHSAESTSVPLLK